MVKVDISKLNHVKFEPKPMPDGLNAGQKLLWHARMKDYSWTDIADLIFTSETTVRAYWYGNRIMPKCKGTLLVYHLTGKLPAGIKSITTSYGKHATATVHVEDGELSDRAHLVGRINLK